MSSFPDGYEPNVRQQGILERLEGAGRVSVAELAEVLDVSDVTIRKDLQDLEEHSLLKRVHGGAVAARRSKYNLSLGYKLTRLSENKRLIAEAALTLVHDGDTLILDAGSTALALARLLPQYRRGLTIVTGSLPVITELAAVPDFELIILGGGVRKHSLSTFGPLSVANLARLEVDTAFLGADGASTERGLSTPDFSVAETKAAMVRAAKTCVVLVDHSKLDQGSLAAFARWEEVQTLVTDAALPEPFATYVQEAGVEVIVAGSGKATCT